MDKAISMIARIPVEPGMNKSKIETWGGINGVDEVVLWSVAMMKRMIVDLKRVWRFVRKQEAMSRQKSKLNPGLCQFLYYLFLFSAYRECSDIM